jgi:hypothetical protein
VSAATDGGVPYREVLEGLLERTRSPQRREEIESELAQPPLPKAVGHIWGAFLRLSAHRQSAGFGPGPITWPDLDAFCRMTRTRLVPWEVEMIEDLDSLWLAEKAREIKARSEK